MYGSIGHHFDTRNHFRSHRNRKYWNLTSADLRNCSRRVPMWLTTAWQHIFAENRRPTAISGQTGSGNAVETEHMNRSHRLPIWLRVYLDYFCHFVDEIVSIGPLWWPHVEYCISAWSPYYVKDKKTLERIHHRFTKLILGLQSLSYEERLERLGLWTCTRRAKEPCRSDRSL